MKRTALDIANDRKRLDAIVDAFEKQEAALLAMAQAVPTVLKPCPFCGGEAAIHVSGSRIYGHGESEDTVSCGCRTCGASFTSSSYAGHQHADRKSEVAMKWNRRDKRKEGA